jgi:hypothetical protein
MKAYEGDNRPDDVVDPRVKVCVRRVSFIRHVQHSNPGP